MCALCRTPLIWVIQFLLIGALQGQSVNRAIEPEQILDRDPPTYCPCAKRWTCPEQATPLKACLFWTIQSAA